MDLVGAEQQGLERLVAAGERNDLAVGGGGVIGTPIAGTSRKRGLDEQPGGFLQIEKRDRQAADDRGLVDPILLLSSELVRPH